MNVQWTPEFEKEFSSSMPVIDLSRYVTGSIWKFKDEVGRFRDKG